MAPTVSLDDVLLRIRSEFLEMPGLKLTPRQAQRLWGLDPETCRALIDRLTEAKFLTLTRHGSIIQRSESL